jgi:putative transposase
MRTEEPFIAILQEHEAGLKGADFCRWYAISEGAFYAWKTKYSGIAASEAK